MYKTYKIILTDIPVDKTSSKPDSLFLILINLFLKKVIIEPMITTGWILVGSSPAMTSIAIDTINESMMNRNKFNETIFAALIDINVFIKLFSIILYKSMSIY